TWSSNMKIGLSAAWPQAHFSLSAGYPKNARSRDSQKVLPASYEEAQTLFNLTIRYCKEYWYLYKIVRKLQKTGRRKLD
ncbi:MAG: hypothetical protein NTX75_04150, partial [Proteobacteria bacterium]|nr:hypothetical protein [Pseudomonadota bacterium]